MADPDSASPNVSPPEISPSVTRQQEAFARTQGLSALAQYKEYAVGSDQSYAALLYYELLTGLFSNLPGLPGFALRALLYPTLFRACGKRPAFGRSVVIRNPRRIAIGQRALIDDFAVLDVRGSGSITLSDMVSIGRFTTIAAKEGDILLAPGANIGSYCRIATNSKVTIGESALIAAYCYIGPGNHQRGLDDQPLISRPMEIKGGVAIGKHAWIGAGTTILDGVTIGAGAIVGAHSLVRHDVPEGAVVAGTPARPLERKI